MKKPAKKPAKTPDANPVQAIKALQHDDLKTLDAHMMSRGRILMQLAEVRIAYDVAARTMAELKCQDSALRADLEKFEGQIAEIRASMPPLET